MSFIDFLAHLVERPTINQNVAGSSPAKINVTLTSPFFHFLERWYNWLTCRPVTPVLRVRVPYAPQGKYTAIYLSRTFRQSSEDCCSNLRGMVDSKKYDVV